MSSNTTVEMLLAAEPSALAVAAGATRWVQLAFGVICMMAISSPQYVWTLFAKPMSAKLGVSLAELQVTFSILIVLQTFLSPVQDLLVDKFGRQPRVAGGVDSEEGGELAVGGNEAQRLSSAMFRPAPRTLAAFRLMKCFRTNPASQRTSNTSFPRKWRPSLIAWAAAASDRR